VGDGALEWRPADDRAGAGGPERGADVVAERLYSQAAGLGESLAYAPSSHTHGTPPAPSFSGEVEIVVAQSTAAAQHYTTRVAGILDFPVEPNAHAPGAGDVLTLTDPGDGKLQWQIGGGGATGSFVVAAGQFDVDGRTVFAHNRLRATQLIPQLPTVYLLSFEEFDPSGRYVVTGAPWTDLDREIPAVFEYIGDARDDKILSRLDNIASNNPALKEVINKFGIERAGILVRVRQINTEPISNGFMVEISRYSE
jgi:hypothetical protein